jgi:hypothetical protein
MLEVRACDKGGSLVSGRLALVLVQVVIAPCLTGCCFNASKLSAACSVLFIGAI